jgi:hypothetical protein
MGTTYCNPFDYERIYGSKPPTDDSPATEEQAVPQTKVVAAPATVAPAPAAVSADVKTG